MHTYMSARLKGKGNEASLTKLGMTPKSNFSDKYQVILFICGL